MNVLLVTHDYEQQNELLPDVIRELNTLGDRFGRRYRARLVHDYAPNLKHQLWTLGRPTVVVSMLPLRRFFPSWATILANEDIYKVQEYTALERAGIPIPKWTVVRQGEEPDLSGFNEFVVVKPAQGGCGALVRIMRRNRVEWRPLEVKKFNWSHMDLIAQEYVHTGPWPVSYRVGTVFGEPIYAWRITADRSRRPFEEGKMDSHFFDGRTIVSSGKGCTFDWEVPQDVFELARALHERAFPNTPLLGSDIIRDVHSGKLYVLEVNANGDNFHLTSRVAQRIKREFNLDSKAQFGGARAVARGIYRRLNQFVSNGRVDELNHLQSDAERMPSTMTTSV